jgi:mRNA interferase RelE/StbE
LNKFRIFETYRFQKDLQRITKSGNKKTTIKLKEYVYPQLKSHPHYGPNIKKLKGFQPETWRYRIGAWRFFYEIDEEEQIVFMVSAYHRSEAY